ncbi:MAG: 6-hydroxynicotinate reductase [Burkholderiaceae bacterium]
MRPPETDADHGSNSGHPDPSSDRSDGLAASDAAVPASGREADATIVCEACPVLCRIKLGRAGACDRYANVDGVLTRLDPLVVMSRRQGEAMVPFAADAQEGALVRDDMFVSGVGAGTTYPDYKPAPFIVSSRIDGADTVTVVTEGIFSYCSFRVKIDSDRYLGPERAIVRHQGEAVGHVTTYEYGSQFLSLGGVHHLTGGSKREGRVTCDLMAALGNREPVELSIEDGARLVVRAGEAPIIDGHTEQRMRVGCGSATIGMFARQWLGHVDEVVVVDDHITGVLSEHQAGKGLSMPATGIRLHGRRSTPGRYFQVAGSGSGWGGTDITDPLSIIERWDPKQAYAGLRMLMVSTTGDDAAYYVLDESLVPQAAPMPGPVRKVVERIGENCEPSLASVVFVAGAGGSLRAGVTENPVGLTRAIKTMLVRVTCGGAPTYVWPGGGITLMTDVAQMPARSFGTVPTPAIVAPIEFTMRLGDYVALGGHADSIRPLSEVLAATRHQTMAWDTGREWPAAPPHAV